MSHIRAPLASNYVDRETLPVKCRSNLARYGNSGEIEAFGRKTA